MYVLQMYGAIALAWFKGWCHLRVLFSGHFDFQLARHDKILQVAFYGCNVLRTCPDVGFIWCSLTVDCELIFYCGGGLCFSRVLHSSDYLPGGPLVGHKHIISN